jgi:hypothetical protein
MAAETKFSVDPDGNTVINSGAVQLNANGDCYFANSGVGLTNDGDIRADGNAQITGNLNVDGASTFSAENISFGTGGSASFADGQIELNDDGSASFASDHFQIDSAGIISAAAINSGYANLASSNFTIDPSGNTVIGGGNILLNANGNGYFVNGLVTAAAFIGSGQLFTNTSSYTLVDGNQNATVIMDSSSATTVSIPTDATFNFPLGTRILIVRKGSGQVTIQVASSPTTIVSAGTTSYAPKISAQYGYVIAIKIASNSWLVTGNVA